MIIPGLNGGIPAQSTQVEMTTGQQVPPSVEEQAATKQVGYASQGEAPASVEQTKAKHAMDHARLDKALQELNQALVGSGTKVVNDPTAPPNTLWLNIVDSTTGAVIERLPPEGLRQYADTASAKGLTLDLKL